MASGEVHGTKEDSSQAVAASGSINLLSYVFNQDYSCFVCGTTSGFRVFTTSPVCEVHRREGTAAFQQRNVVLISMLFKTNIFAMVTVSDDDPSNGGANKVQIWDDQKGKFVGELRSRNEVKGVALRRDIIAMVCEYAIYVYTCDKLRVIMHLTTNANSKGLCAISPSSDPWILACPGQSTGAVRIQVGRDDQLSHVFTAHQTGLAALTLNASGSLVATASENGTVVKVFQASDGQVLYRLRRSARPAAISCLAFRSDDRFLAVASSTATVHIFRLDDEGAKEGERPEAQEAPPSPPAAPALLLGPGAPPAPAAAAGGDPAERRSSEMEEVMGAVRNVAGGLMPRYFSDTGSLGYFRIPDVDSAGQPVVDTRSQQSRISGPQLAFHKTEAKLSVLHYNGVLYECSFKPDHDFRKEGAQECGLVAGTTWFAVRPDFKVQGTAAQLPTVAGGASDDDDDAEAWNLI